MFELTAHGHKLVNRGSENGKGHAQEPPVKDNYQQKI